MKEEGVLLYKQGTFLINILFIGKIDIRCDGIAAIIECKEKDTLKVSLVDR